MRLDLGDVALHLDVRVRGLRRHHILIHVGAPADTTPADRTAGRPPYSTRTERTDLIMDLQADKQVPLSVEWTDEVGNPTQTPADATVTYTVDDPTIINLSDAGDGSATAAATGALGVATVHVEATSAGRTVTGDLAINVVAGLAERLNVVAGDPTEVTPDA